MDGGVVRQALYALVREKRSISWQPKWREGDERESDRGPRG